MFSVLNITRKPHLIITGSNSGCGTVPGACKSSGLNQATSREESPICDKNEFVIRCIDCYARFSRDLSNNLIRNEMLMVSLTQDNCGA